eukprot:2432779-Pleurochrysis_carterae.AAC.1
MKRRSVSIDPAMTVQPEMDRGTGTHRSPLFPWRRGVVGCLQDWAPGSIANMIKLIVMVTNYFKVSDA